MAFVVEDGTGLANANAFVDVAYVLAYFEDRGTDLKNKADDLKAAIIQATEFIQNEWGDDFLGTIATTTQMLCFPRDNVPIRFQTGEVYASTTLPAELQRATAELANFALSEELYAVGVKGNISAIAVSESAGEESKSTSYSGGGLDPNQKTLPVVEKILQPILEVNPNFLVR